MNYAKNFKSEFLVHDHVPGTQWVCVSFNHVQTAAAMKNVVIFFQTINVVL